MVIANFLQTQPGKNLSINHGQIRIDPQDVYFIPEHVYEQFVKQKVPIHRVNNSIFSQSLKYRGQPLANKTLIIFFSGGFGDCMVLCSILQQMQRRFHNFKIFFSVTPEYQDILTLFNLKATRIPPFIRLRELTYYDYFLEIGYIGKYAEFKSADVYQIYCDLLHFHTRMSTPEIKIPSRKIHAMQLKESVLKSVGIFPGGNSPLRTLSPDYTKNLIQCLIDSNYVVYLLGTPIKGFQVDFVHPAFKNMMGRTVDFLEAAALMKQLDFIISIDGSLMHLAAMLGKPTIALFNIIAPGLRISQYHSVTALTPSLPCSPCFTEKNNCPIDNNHCKWLDDPELKPAAILNVLQSLEG